jgi:hypothetical protein
MLAWLVDERGIEPHIPVFDKSERRPMEPSHAPTSPKTGKAMPMSARPKSSCENTVERAIRPQTITRKNALFAGSDGGGRTWATIATLLATARLNGIDPQAWLSTTLESIAGGRSNGDLDALMPWNYQRS